MELKRMVLITGLWSRQRDLFVPSHAGHKVAPDPASSACGLTSREPTWAPMSVY